MSDEQEVNSDPQSTGNNYEDQRTGAKPSRFGKSARSRKVLGRAQRLGMSRKELAEAAGLRPEAVTRWFGNETGRGPTNAQWKSIAGALHVELKFLLDDSIPVKEAIAANPSLKYQEKNDEILAVTRIEEADSIRKELVGLGWTDDQIDAVVLMISTTGPKEAITRLKSRPDATEGRQTKGG